MSSGSAKVLEKINKARSDNRTIIYLDETWYHTYDTLSEFIILIIKKNIPLNKGKRITILYAGSGNS